MIRIVVKRYIHLRFSNSVTNINDIKLKSTILEKKNRKEDWVMIAICKKKMTNY